MGRIRLALRVAYPSSSRRRVHVGGRRYNYVYRAWNFNFHHRGKVGERYSDFFACIPLVPGQQLDLTQAFVIPWEAISGKTFYLPDSRRVVRRKIRDVPQCLAADRRQVRRARGEPEEARAAIDQARTRAGSRARKRREPSRAGSERAGCHESPP